MSAVSKYANTAGSMREAQHTQACVYCLLSTNAAVSAAYMIVTLMSNTQREKIAHRMCM
jgi:hypothetical protein